MSYCLNPYCKHPKNAESNKFCQSCGAQLLLKERYRAIKAIGQGGFGRTFLGVDEDIPSKPPRVIKQFLPTTQGTESLQKATELFNQEAVRLDELGKHPQIPELFAHFEQDKYLYLVQEYIDGENLAQTLKEEGIFQETQIRELLLSLLPVLQFIHEHNVIHRDIKPENLIKRRTNLTPQPTFHSSQSSLKEGRKEEYVLVDFGAARCVTGKAILKTGTIIGDHRYMPDEQLKGKTDFTSDLYSLGLTCLHLLTQVEPWDLYDNSEDRWVWRDYLTASISDNLGQVLDKMIQKGTKRRYQSAIEVLEALTSVETVSPSPNVQVSQPSSSQAILTTSPPINPTLKPFESDNQRGYKDGTGKWGYKDGTGKIVIPPQFDKAWDFIEGLAMVKLGSKHGYIDRTAQIVTPPQFDWAWYFSEGLAAVKIGSKWGYIDMIGKIVIPLQFNWGSPFSEGLARVKKDSKWGYINRSGQIIIPYQFYETEHFCEGLAAVKIGSKWGYINTTGKIIVLNQFDEAWNFSEGLAAVKIGSKWGYINTTGKIVISPHFASASNFRDGKALVTIKSLVFFEDEYYIDKNGQFIN